MKQLLAPLLLTGAVFCTTAACSSAKDRSGHWIEVVQQAHRVADDASSSPAQTERRLRDAISQAPDDPGESERWILQDLHYRLAQLLVDGGSVDRATQEVEAGLRLSTNATLARANLLAIQGKILQQKGETEAAAAAYHAALLINELLMDQALSGSSQEPGRP